MSLQKLKWLGGVPTDDVPFCDLLVAGDLKRTVKLLEAVALGKLVVSPMWVVVSFRQRRFAGTLPPSTV